ncbi:hypothetical protein Daudx_1860 [Candidatus Desulforudis audaxviator]|nr:hypothetical protein Daudx_1860 [Candidatus Desulforudis audaxviator]
MSLASTGKKPYEKDIQIHGNDCAANGENIWDGFLESR